MILLQDLIDLIEQKLYLDNLERYQNFFLKEKKKQQLHHLLVEEKILEAL
jgi:hypothetical protein